MCPAVEDDEAICAAILAAASHYEVLQVEPKQCEASVIRRNYIRISVKVHPDRNRSPNATQAFQRVAEAYEVLNDDEKRNNYDKQRDYDKSSHSSSWHSDAASATSFSFEDAIRVFRMAVRAAEVASMAASSTGGVEDALSIASALIALRVISGNNGDATNFITSIAAGANAAMAHLPESMQTSIKRNVTPENALRVVGVAAIFAGAYMTAARSRNHSDI